MVWMASNRRVRLWILDLGYLIPTGTSREGRSDFEFESVCKWQEYRIMHDNQMTTPDLVEAQPNDNEMTRAMFSLRVCDLVADRTYGIIDRS